MPIVSMDRPFFGKAENRLDAIVPFTSLRFPWLIHNLQQLESYATLLATSNPFRLNKCV